MQVVWTNARGGAKACSSATPRLREQLFELGPPGWSPSFTWVEEPRLHPLHPTTPWTPPPFEKRLHCATMNTIRSIQKLNQAELDAAVPPESSWHTNYRDTAYI